MFEGRRRSYSAATQCGRRIDGTAYVPLKAGWGMVEDSLPRFHENESRTTAGIKRARRMRLQ